MSHRWDNRAQRVNHLDLTGAVYSRNSESGVLPHCKHNKVQTKCLFECKIPHLACTFSVGVAFTDHSIINSKRSADVQRDISQEKTLLFRGEIRT